MQKLLSILATGVFLTLISGCLPHSKAPQDTVVLEKVSQGSQKNEWKYALQFKGKRWYIPHPVGWFPDTGHWTDVSNTIFLNQDTGKTGCEDIKISVITYRNNQFCQGSVVFIDSRVLVDLQFKHEDKISIMRRVSDVGEPHDTYRSVNGNPAVFGDRRLDVFHGYIKELWPEYRVVDRHRMAPDSVSYHYRKLKKLGLNKDEEFIVYSKEINDESLSIDQIEEKLGVKVVYRGSLGDFTTGFKLKELLPDLWAHGRVSARLPKHPKLLIFLENNSEAFEFNGEYKVNLVPH